MAAQTGYDPEHLMKLHPVPEFDGRIVLDEPSHVYTITPMCAYGELQKPNVDCNFSVTTFVKKYFNEFNADEVIKNMMSGASWKPGHKYWGRTAEDIKTEWSQNKAAEFGTELHAKIEKFYNIPELYNIVDRRLTADDLVPTYYKPDEVVGNYEFLQFLDFHYEFIGPRRWIPWRTELRVFDTELVLAGSVDMIFLDPDIDKRLHIVDWKRCKEIKKKSFYNRAAGGSQKGRGPCFDLEDCNFNHYALQLNTYAAILARNLYKSSGYTVGDLYLAVFHPVYSKDYLFSLATDEVRAAVEAAAAKDEVPSDNKKTKKRKIDMDDKVQKLIKRKYSKGPFGFQAEPIPNKLTHVANMMFERQQSLSKIGSSIEPKIITE